MKLTMSRFLSKRLENLIEYVPGEQPRDMQYVKLNTNESPFPPSPSVLELMTEGNAKDMRLYSDPTCKELTDAVCKVYGIGKDCIIFGNGSDEILSFAFTAFCDSCTPAVFADITYGFYKVFADLNCISSRIIPLRDDFTINVKDYKNAGGTVFIANPNAPTGLTLTIDEIREILVSNKNNVVVIDEAYVDFGGESCYKLINEFDNLLVVQTFSKSRSLAGARLGFGIASPAIISDLQRIRNSNNPYNINRMTQMMGKCSIVDTDYFKECTGQIIKNREFLTSELIKRDFEVIPSKANFVFAKHKVIDGETIYSELKKLGVLVRHFDKPRISLYNRITVGNAEEVNNLIASIDNILERTK